VLAEDQGLTRAGLRSLLEQCADLEVVGEAADGEAAVAVCLETRPDVVVMDIAMPKLNGIEATRRILKELPATKVVALSMHADSQYVLEMLRAGATGYLLKDCVREDLAQAIRSPRERSRRSRNSSCSRRIFRKKWRSTESPAPGATGARRSAPST